MTADISRLLPHWRVSEEPAAASEIPPGQILWEDGRCLRLERTGETLRLLFGDDAAAQIDLAARSIVIRPVHASVARETLDHFLSNQVMPRIMAHQGDFVIHAAAIAHDGALFLLIGDSGQGKSTLAASFGQDGKQVLGDDAVRLSLSDAGVKVEAISTNLRLRQDAAHALGMEGRSIRSHGKARFRAGSGPLATVRAEKAVLFILGPGPDGGIHVRRLSLQQTCVHLLQESFALDPTDAQAAARRLEQASAVAERVPCFELTYPRDYARLPEVKQLLEQAVESCVP